jgi:hypothetical protein
MTWPRQVIIKLKNCRNSVVGCALGSAHRYASYTRTRTGQISVGGNGLKP